MLVLNDRYMLGSLDYIISRAFPPHDIQYSYGVVVGLVLVVG